MASNYINSSTANLPRGIRNNNPGNIKDDGTSWQGQVGTDGTFVTFDDMSWGTRALGKALINMIGRGLDTINTLIATWAPPSENDTDAYIAAVATDSGIPPSEQLGTDQQTIASLMRAIVNHENGQLASVTYVTDQDIADGLAKLNSSAFTAAQSVVVAAEVNPVKAIAAIAGGVLVLSWLFKK